MYRPRNFRVCVRGRAEGEKEEEKKPGLPQDLEDQGPYA